MTKAKSKLSLEEVEAFLTKEYGQGFIISGDNFGTVGRIPSGVLSLDRALGGGFPRGRITEIFGAASSGKTILTYATIAQAQKGGGVCIFIDAEKTFDPDWATKNGVDVSRVNVIQPSYGEQAWEAIEYYLSSGEVDLLVLDSLAACIPKAELDGEMGDANIGLHARMNSKACRKVTSYFGVAEAKNQRTALVIINQERANVSTAGYGASPNTTTGGRSLPFYASVRLEIRRIGWVTKGGEEPIGAVSRIRFIKAKVTGIQPRAVVEFEVDFGTGIDFAKDILNHAIAKGWIVKAGSWFTIKDNEEVVGKVQGEIEAKNVLKTSGLLDKWTGILLNA